MHALRASLRLAAPAAALLAAATTTIATAQLHEGDIAIDVVDQRLWVGDIQGGVPVAEDVFGVAFGSSGIPAFTADPGLNAAAGTFSPGSRIGFNFRTALAVWNGEGFDPLPADGSAERLRITFFTAAATSGDGFVPGFDLQVQPDGGFHKHLGMSLLAPSGASLPTPGTYLMEFELTSTDPAVAVSPPYWFVFDHEADADAFAAAVDHVRTVIADPPADPCPADIDGSGAVDFGDILTTLGAWGACGEPCPADLDGSGAVDFPDLLGVLSAWGPCPD